MTVSKEFKVGLLVTITLTMLYIGANFLKGKDLFASSKIYYTSFQNVKGLNKGNIITLNGLSVGKIQKIDILAGEPHQVQVTLAIDKKIKLTNHTVARLESSLLGSKNIELLVKSGEELQPYSSLQGEIEQDFTSQFVEKSFPALNDIKTITLLMSQFMQNMVENTDRINTIFGHLEHTSKQLDTVMTANNKNFTNISENVANILHTLASKDTGIEPLLIKTNQLLYEAQNLQVHHTITKLNDILTQLADGPLYQNIDQTFTELNKLLIDFQSQPSRYVQFSIFGNKSIANPSKKKRHKPVSIVVSRPTELPG
jgi:phospholipid/cholesterol/gamma-HCH transport system substrate-binding protein